MKKVNEFFGISLSLIGILKILLMIFIFIGSASSANALVNEGTSNSFDSSMFSKPLAIIQLIFGGLSIIMIFANIKSDLDIVTGYVMGIIALALELFLPSIVHFVAVWVEAFLYVKGGNKIRSKSLNLFNISFEKTNEEKVESTDWFYGDDKK